MEGDKADEAGGECGEWLWRVAVLPEQLKSAPRYTGKWLGADAER